MIIFQHTQSGFRITIECLTAQGSHPDSQENSLRRSRETILAMVAEQEGLKSATLLNGKRTKHLSHLRYKAMYLMWGEGYSVYEIAKFFGKDRGTVKHGIEKMRMKGKMQELERKI
jgi:chromosomal replication initiation ATPase DnaA